MRYNGGMENQDLELIAQELQVELVGIHESGEANRFNEIFSKISELSQLETARLIYILAETATAAHLALTDGDHHNAMINIFRSSGILLGEDNDLPF